MQPPGYHSHERSALVDFALRSVDARVRALDVGCAEGRLGSELLRRGFAEVWGVEPEESPASRACVSLTKVIARPFPCVEVEAGAPFDLVVFADSLEHLVDTDAALAFAHGLLGDNGRMVVSVPNVSHYSVVKELACGRWTYTEEGLLDKAHVRFFTPIEIRNVLMDAGFTIIAEEQVMQRPRRRWLPLARPLEALASHLFVFQQYLAATKTGATQ